MYRIESNKKNAMSYSANNLDAHFVGKVNIICVNTASGHLVTAEDVHRLISLLQLAAPPQPASCLLLLGPEQAAARAGARLERPEYINMHCWWARA